MKLKKQVCYLILFTVSVLLLYQPILFATDNSPDNKKGNTASTSKRPIPEFDHELHKDTLDEPECFVCHHAMDDASGKLIYSEDEEGDCSACHAETADDDVLALREANHASCTACHRKFIKQKKSAGPTTCGECHKK